MMRNIKQNVRFWVVPLLFALSVTVMMKGVTPARADLKVDITSGKIEPLPIALPDFFGSGKMPEENWLGLCLVQSNWEVN